LFAVSLEFTWCTCFGVVWAKPGPEVDPDGRGKCCSGPRSSKQVLYQHGTGRPGVPSVPLSSPQVPGSGQSRSRNAPGESTGGDTVPRLVRSLSPDTRWSTLAAWASAIT